MYNKSIDCAIAKNLISTNISQFMITLEPNNLKKINKIIIIYIRL